MEIYFAGVKELIPRLAPEVWSSINVLESFYYLNPKHLPKFRQARSFMLDSGAYSFRVDPSIKLDWDVFLNRYAEFVRDFEIEKFFELDIDMVVGYKKVLEFRDRLEKIVGRQCIPVWHKNRGVDDFVQMCKDYSYVALVGMSSGDVTKKDFLQLQKFIDTAHNYDAKIHGLGFTQIKPLHYCHFDSVDSTSWNAGMKYGIGYEFKNNWLYQIKKKPGQRCRGVEANVQNFSQWVLFSKYARSML